MTPPVAKRVETTRVHHDDDFVDHYEWLRDKSDPEVIAHLEAENAHVEDGHRRPGAVAAEDLRRDQGAHQGDRSVGADCGAATGGTTAAASRASSTGCTAAARSPVPTTGLRRSSTSTPTSPVSRCCSTRTSKPTATTSSRSAPRRQPGRQRAGVLGRRQRRRAIHAAVQGLTHRRAISPTQITGIAAGCHLGGRQQSTCTTPPSTRHGGPTPCGGTGSGHTGPDEQVFHEPDERFWVAVGRTRSNAYIVIAAGSSITSEVRVADASIPTREFTVVLPRRDGVEYSVEHAVVDGEDRFLILHNDGAANFTLVEAPGRRPHRAAHADRAPRRRPTGGCRRVLRPPRGALPPRGAAPTAAVADRRRAYGTPEEITFDSELMACGLGGNPNWERAAPADRRHVVPHPDADL